jgi:hypothetical protein
MKRLREMWCLERAFVETTIRLAAVVVGCALLGAGAPARAQEATPPESPAPPLKPLSVPLPIGQKSRGIKIPQFNLTGQVLSQLLAGQVHRVDDEFLQIQELKLDFYDDNGQNEFRIDMPTSLFSTKTRIITSEEPVFIHHRDFDLTGAKLEFNTATRKGRLFGPVTMIVRDLERAGAKDTPTVPAAPASPTPPNPAAPPKQIEPPPK